MLGTIVTTGCMHVLPSLALLPAKHQLRCPLICTTANGFGVVLHSISLQHPELKAIHPVLSWTGLALYGLFTAPSEGQEVLPPSRNSMSCTRPDTAHTTLYVPLACGLAVIDPSRSLLGLPWLYDHAASVWTSLSQRMTISFTAMPQCWTICGTQHSAWRPRCTKHEAMPIN